MPTPPCPPFTRGERKRIPVALASRDIKPLFVKNCTVCHRASKRDDPDISGGLALDTYEAVLAGTKREKVIVPGRSAESELARRLADADDDRRMPLQDRPLAGPQQDLVRRWIDQGAARGVLVKTALAARPVSRSRPATVRALLEVVLPTEVKLSRRAPGMRRRGVRCRCHCESGRCRRLRHWRCGETAGCSRLGRTGGSCCGT